MSLIYKYYMFAIKNEKSIDDYFYRIYDRNPKLYGCIPRPAVWMATFSKYKYIVFLLSFFLKFALFLGGWFFLFLKDYFIFKKNFNGNVSCVAEDSVSVYGLGFSERAYDVIDNKLFPDFKVKWLSVPWVVVENKESINCFSFITKKEAFLCIFKSLFIVYRLILENDKDVWILQCYTVYRWVLVRHALSKIKPNKIVCSEHFDRWAVLVDSLFVERELIGIEHVYTFCIVQHGILSDLKEKDNCSLRLPFDLYYKLEMVTDVFAYDDESVSIFSNQILSELNVSKGFCFNLYNNKINLEEELFRDARKYSILFVGHPSCIEQQVFLFNMIDTRIKCYYKPHPALKTPAVVYKTDWEVIDNKNIFPKVDLLISYPSTLVREYSQHGVFSVVHSLNANEKELLSCLEIIFCKVRSYLYE